MSDQDAAKNRFCVSQEELLFLTRALELPHLPGMNEFPYEGLDETLIDHLINAGGRALLAREVLAVSPENQLLLDRGVQAVLFASTHPEQSVLITSRTGKGETINRANYYRVPEFSVIHTPVAGLHWFELRTDQAMGDEYAQGLVEQHDFKVSFSPITVKQTDLDAVVNLASQSHELAAKSLTEMGVPSAIAEQLLAALSQLRYRLQIQWFAEGCEDGLTLLAGEDTWWVFSVEDRSSSQITMQGMTTQEALDVIQQKYRSMEKK